MSDAGLLELELEQRYARLRASDKITFLGKRISLRTSNVAKPKEGKPVPICYFKVRSYCISRDMHKT